MTTFKIEQHRLLVATLNQEKILAKAGSMVAYSGNIKFEKAILGGEGLLGVVKRKVTDESFTLMVVKGAGTVYLADQAQEITILELRDERMFIESHSLLAFDAELKTNVSFAGFRGATTGQGLFTTTVSGRGQVAVVSTGNLLTFLITPTTPLYVDPDAFIGYQGNLKQEFILDVNWKTLMGEASGETYQLKFTGDGIVYIQPSERR